MEKEQMKVLYFSEELKNLLAESENAGFTILCAPSGFGKTIALRRMTNGFKGKVFRINLYGGRQQDFFEELCQTILGRNCAISKISEFIHQGVPGSAEARDRFLSEVERICDREGNCLIAIDDYHRGEKAEYTEFLYYLANELRDKLRIVVSAQHLDFKQTDERVAKGEIYYISKEDLRLTEKGTAEYFRANGVEITPRERRQVYEESLGWFAMLHVILQHYRMTEEFSGYDDRALFDMLKHNNYLLLPAECKKFIHRVLPAKTWTREEAVYLAGGGESAEALLDYTVEKAGFIFYNLSKRVYCFHPFYKTICQVAFSNLATDEKNTIQKRYDNWKSEHFLDRDQPDLLHVFNEGSPVELSAKVDALGIESRTDREQLKEILKVLQNRNSPGEAEDSQDSEINLTCTGLTKRENEIASLAAKGLYNKEVADKLEISENTVKSALKSIFKKLDIQDRRELSGKFKL